MIYIFDIDGTVCSQTKSDYINAKPLTKRIEKINELYDKGNKIIYYTSRGMNRFHNDEQKCYTSYYNMTKVQLGMWGCKYDELIMGKKPYDMWIDNKSFNDKEYFKDVD